MAFFKKEMEGRDIDDYRALLSPDFTFDGKADVTYGYDAEISIMNNIFNEIEGESGIVISDIVTTQLDPDGVWRETPEEDEMFGQYAGSWDRRYDLELNFYIQGQDLHFQAAGYAVFYVANSGTAQDPDYKILGIKDLTNGDKGVENHSWTAVKALFI